MLPFVHALDLALLIHALAVERLPETPFVFAAERQQASARQFAERLGMALLTDDPLREKLILEEKKKEMEKKPKPLTR